MNAFEKAIQRLEREINDLGQPVHTKYLPLLRELHGVLRLVKKASSSDIERFCVRENEDGWGRTVQGIGLCASPEGDLVRYSDHCLRIAAIRAHDL